MIAGSFRDGIDSAEIHLEDRLHMNKSIAKVGSMMVSGFYAERESGKKVAAINGVIYAAIWSF